MISLDTIRQRVKSQTSHYPSTVGYNTELDELINAAQEDLWNSQPWLFRHREAELAIRPDITSDTITVTVANMGRVVTFSSSLADLGYNFYGQTFEGQVIELDGRDYTILAVKTTTVIILAEPYRGTALSGYADWTIKHPYYRLPADCQRILSWSQEDKPYSSSTYSRAQFLPITTLPCRYSHQDVGDWAQTLFKVDNLVIPPAEKLSITYSSSVSSEALPQNKWNEFAWSFKWGNEYGPLSAGLKTKSSSGTRQTAVISCLDMLGNPVSSPIRTDELKPYPTNWEGIRKVLWFNSNINPSATSENAVRLGLPCWKPVLDYDPAGDQYEFRQLEILWNQSNFALDYAGCLNTSANSNITRPTTGVISTPNRWIPHTIQQVRPYPRISSSDIVYAFSEATTQQPKEKFKRVIIRYLGAPEDMSLDTDAISIPDECVSTLVYKVLVDTFNKKGDAAMASFYTTKYEAELNTMMRNHIAFMEDNLSLGRWGYGSSRLDNSWVRGPVIFNTL